MLPIGIDISKATFDVAYLQDHKFQNNKFNNDLKGIKSFIKWLKPINEVKVFCMEATGIYGVMLAKYLHSIDEKIIVVNPIKTSSFAKMTMCRNKTDKADAQLIAKYAQHVIHDGKLEKSLYKPKTQAYEDLQFFVSRLDQLDKLLTAERNRLPVAANKKISKSIISTKKHLEKQIALIKQEIRTLVTSDNKLKKEVDLLISINGIGELTAWSILAYLGDISLFSNAKQVTSFAGLNPSVFQSGTSINRSSLSKMGNKKLRKSLYMPAIVAKKYNPVMARLYDRILEKGKAKKVAICAVMRKMLVIAYGVLKSGKAFDINYSS